jgi:hypothetical protein
MDISWLPDFGNNMYFFFLSYVILGAGLKYIDDAFDEKTFSKKKAFVIAPLLGIFGAFTITISPFSATILVAVVLGVLFKGKVDNRAHLISFFTFFIIVIMLGIVNIMILPLIFLTAAGVLDEIGNDAVDYNGRFHKYKKFKYQFALYFFGRRYLMKVALFFLILVGVFPLYFLIAFILFDESYIVVGLYSHSKKHIPLDHLAPS